MIPYGRQTISSQDIEAVIEVLRSDFLTQGPALPQFEAAVAAYCGVPHAVAVNSATSALHIACLALGVGPGDRVWTSPNTFVASANCARYCGADVDFVDIDPLSYNLSLSALEEKLQKAEHEGLLPKVVIPVHFAGLPCDMAGIQDLAKRYGFRIIEDASHAFGARYRGSIVGNCAYSDVSVFSFHPVKIMTTGEGGIATTRSPELSRRMQLLRTHGITREAGELSNRDQGGWYYEQQLLGFNYRMTDIQAALGFSQLKNLDCWVSRRHDIASNYDHELQDMPVIRPVQSSESYSALHLYPIQVENRRTVYETLRKAGIGVNVHYMPVHLQPYYRRLGFRAGQYPKSEHYYQRAISIPIFPGLSACQQERVVEALRKAL